MDIFERIEDDHHKQRALMNKLLETEGKSDTRQQLFDEFCAEFTAHAAAEEHAFYAEMMKCEETTDQSRHSVAEHSTAMELVEELKKTDMSSPGWLATFKKLAHDNEHHMEEEEQDVFPAVKKHLTDSALEKMLPVFDERKESELAAVGA